MKNFVRKMTFAICMVILSVGWAVAQTETVKHIVERGETLSSIAEHYSITKDRIIELNPSAAQFVYVGMELTIPVETTTNPVKKERASQQTITAYDQQNSSNRYIDSSNRNIDNSRKYVDDDYAKWRYGLRFTYGFLPKPEQEDVNGNAYIFTVSVGANYYFTKSIYAGARFGYANSQSISSMRIDGYQNFKQQSHAIILPLEVGYDYFLVEDKVSVVPYAGIDINCVVKSTMETGVGTDTEKESIDIDNNFSACGRVGLRFNLWGLELGGSFVLPFGDQYGEKKGFPEISLGGRF